MVSAKDKTIWCPNLLLRSSNMNMRYRNPDNDPHDLWKSGDLSVKRIIPKDIYEIIILFGHKIMPPNARS
ncbi:hypothetical protein GGR08_000700 [Bartonella fuyuanensis]|uniref:Uncharacterized protein n=1 Tax=Bartonella fuyuanensis TaxID=1460968 RepID=A0A840DXK5_9HYPH|nr:hypothetical protein [Bartonella fuyuanensis]MBB4076403.1 hypothetical protein [Bartonella fuyuanensis]